MPNIRLDQVQLVLFSPVIAIADKLKTANALNGVLSGILDGDPGVLPLPDDAPSEIPRILLKSKDEQYKLQIANKRIDFIFCYKKDEEETLFLAPGLFEKFAGVFQYFKENIHTQFTRSAIVTNWIIELEKFPGAEYLLTKYIHEEAPLRDPYELELHYLTKESVAGFNVNKWTRIKSARKISEPEQNKLIVFHIDINTLAEETYEFDEELLQKFLNEGSKVVNDTIEIHLKRMEE